MMVQTTARQFGAMILLAFVLPSCSDAPTATTGAEESQRPVPQTLTHEAVDGNGDNHSFVFAASGDRVEEIRHQINGTSFAIVRNHYDADGALLRSSISVTADGKTMTLDDVQAAAQQSPGPGPTFAFAPTARPYILDGCYGHVFNIAVYSGLMAASVGIGNPLAFAGASMGYINASRGLYSCVSHRTR